MKRVLSVILCATLFLTGVLPTFAALEITAEEASAAALKFTPGDSKHIQTKDDGNRFEVTLFSEQLSERYEIDISKVDGSILSFDSDVDGYRGASSVKLSEAAAKKAVTDEIKNTRSVSVFVEWNDGGGIYRISFSAPACYGEYKVHALSGRVMERDITFGTSESQPADSAYLTVERATTIANEALNGRVTDFDFDYKNGRYVYEVEIYKDSADHDILLDAETGEILSTNSVPNDDYDEIPSPPPPTLLPHDDRYISIRTARLFAENKAAGLGRVVSIERTTDDGRTVYQGKMLSEDYTWECEFTIDATNGAILEWEPEWIPEEND